MADWTEIRIPVPWGFIAAKTMGHISGKPMICVHGNVDNAASFDNILPLFPSMYYYVCLDLPGHGWSSHYGPGIPYRFIDYVTVLKRVVDFFKWEKVNILGHNTGGLLGLYYASCFTDDVEKLIVLDTIVIENNVCFNQHLSNIASNLLDNNLGELVKSDFESLCREIQSWRTFPLSPQAEKLLMGRNLLKSQNGFKLAMDPRVAFMHHLPNQKKLLMSLLKSMKCQLLLVMCKNVIHYKNVLPVKILINTFRKNCEKVEYHLVDDIHDVHINRPEKLCGIIHNFLQCSRSSL